MTAFDYSGVTTLKTFFHLFDNELRTKLRMDSHQVFFCYEVSVSVGVRV